MPYTYPGTITPALKTRIANAFVGTFNYTGTNPDTGQAETKAQFFDRCIVHHIMTVVEEYEGRVAGNAARDAARLQAHTDFADLT